jgi:hypothetical protein
MSYGLLTLLNFFIVNNGFCPKLVAGHIIIPVYCLAYRHANCSFDFNEDQLISSASTLENMGILTHALYFVDTGL